jgi:predicted Rossmann fold flavoprotein
MKTIVIIGGGAAGFFAAINCAEKNPGYKVIILEKSNQLLAKVKVSGGGRCNVTHACFEPRQLVKNYPRGEKQLLGPFTRFNPTDTIEWFRKRGVQLKTEADGRMFPATDQSQTIISCFLDEAKKLGIAIKLLTGVKELRQQDGKWQVMTSAEAIIEADKVIVTAGSSAGVWKMLENLGLKIIQPVPSLFTFNIKDERLKGLEGISVPNGTVSLIPNPRSGIPQLKSSGPVLITHWGLSGPGILRLSAWGARSLASAQHQFEIEVNWLGDTTGNAVVDSLKQYKVAHPKQIISSNPQFNMPSRLWSRLVEVPGTTMRFADLSNKQIIASAQGLTASRFKVTGKSTYKDEFVTAGGVDLNEIDFKTMESKKFPGLYFAGEVLDIDAITGGFNFQCAWTTGYIAATSL